MPSRIMPTRNNKLPTLAKVPKIPPKYPECCFRRRHNPPVLTLRAIAGADPEGRPTLTLVPFSLDALLTRLESSSIDSGGGNGGGGIVGGKQSPRFENLDPLSGGGGLSDHMMSGGGRMSGSGMNRDIMDAAALGREARGAAAAALFRLASEPLGKSALASRPAAVAGLVALLSSSSSNNGSNRDDSAAAVAAAGTLWVATIRVEPAGGGLAGGINSGVSTPGGGGSLGGSGFSTPGLISSFLLGAAAGNDAAQVIAGHLANHHLAALAAALPRRTAATDVRDVEQARATAMRAALGGGGGLGGVSSFLEGQDGDGDGDGDGASGGGSIGSASGMMHDSIPSFAAAAAQCHVAAVVGNIAAMSNHAAAVSRSGPLLAGLVASLWPERPWRLRRAAAVALWHLASSSSAGCRRRVGATAGIVDALVMMLRPTTTTAAGAGAGVGAGAGPEAREDRLEGVRLAAAVLGALALEPACRELIGSHPLALPALKDRVLRCVGRLGAEPPPERHDGRNGWRGEPLSSPERGAFLNAAAAALASGAAEHGAAPAVMWWGGAR
jgi:hypothetical protein